jgi:hypothetical protein
MDLETEEESSLPTCQWYVFNAVIQSDLKYEFIQIDDPGDPDSRTQRQKLDFSNFKREVYHKVLEVVFIPLRSPSCSGMAITCGDNVTRVLYSGIPIETLDGEEATSAAACRAALANYPCPKCLVHHDDLHNIDQQYMPRTTKNMSQVYSDSQAASSRTAAEDILKEYGLHAVKVCMPLYIYILSDSVITIIFSRRISSGASAIQIHMRLIHMTSYIRMTLVNGVTISFH